MLECLIVLIPEWLARSTTQAIKQSGNQAFKKWVVQNRCLLPADHEEAFYDVWDIQYNRDIDSLLLLVKQGGHSGKRDGIVKFDNNSFSSFSYTYPVYPEAGDKTQFLEKKEPEGKMSSFRLPANNDRNLNISTDHYVRSVTLSVVAVDCGEMRSEYPE